MRAVHTAGTRALVVRRVRAEGRRVRFVRGVSRRREGARGGRRRRREDARNGGAETETNGEGGERDVRGARARAGGF